MFRRQRTVHQNLIPDGIGTVSLTVYKCNLHEDHLYEKEAVAGLHQQLQAQLTEIIREIQDRRGLRKKSCLLQFPYLDYNNGNSRIRRDIESTKMCLLCVSNHMTENRENIKQECFYIEEEKESQ